MGSKPNHDRRYRRLCQSLRAWREGAGLTQRQLGAKLGRVYSFVYKVETAQRRIDPVEMADWCRACGVDPADAIRGL